MVVTWVGCDDIHFFLRISYFSSKTDVRIISYTLNNVIKTHVLTNFQADTFHTGDEMRFVTCNLCDNHFGFPYCVL